MYVGMYLRMDVFFVRLPYACVYMCTHVCLSNNACVHI